MQFWAITFWQKLQQWDESLFTKLNGDWTNGLFDSIMPFVRSPVIWIPLYLFVAVFVTVNFKSRGLWWLILFVCTVALTDLTGNYVFKQLFHRIRPCNDPAILSHLRLLLKDCGGGYSFISNHAANHFGMATFIFITMRPILSKWSWIVFFWAALICYAQIYVGLHYPLDVLCGALLGVVLGIFTGSFFNKRFQFAIFGNQPSA